MSNHTIHTIEELDTRFDPAYREKHWCINHETGIWISHLIKKHDIQNIVEIGTSVGVSTAYFSLSIGKEGRVKTIESHSERRQCAIQNWVCLETQANIYSILDHAPEALTKLDLSSTQLVFIDCIKLYYLACTELILQKSTCKYILLDNTISHSSSLVDFFKTLDILVTNNVIEYTTYSIGSGLTVITRLSS